MTTSKKGCCFIIVHSNQYLASDSSPQSTTVRVMLPGLLVAGQEEWLIRVAGEGHTARLPTTGAQ